ncbi:aldehyde dehydrogenase (NAD+) [Haloechinothrix alba]|uniref:Aldehyde dehydrogenase (NAD+) n=1 Tax=Haloechinothrix alba TaxID=664784 RepID=A0A239A1Z4_9PSEU|nr:aldehyde dehydrogenase [Haloechinothrix alba]SNR89422.1 aldehyde dehydrogenase (NAD+) [Haloechinothrix alba]
MTLWPETASGILVDGRLRAAEAGREFETVNPATEAVLGRAADAGPADMSEAIAAARRAFDESSWPRDVGFRVHCLRQLSAALRAHADELRDITIAEAGAPRMLTHGPQLDIPVADLEWFADLADSYTWTDDLGTAEPMGIPSRRRVRREPAGVVGAITPWNFPHQINFAKLGPALAAGNTLVLKPAPDTPWCAAVVGRIIAEETDIPPGVVNVVTSSEHTLGTQLAEDPRVDVISFTGSTATGSAVMSTAARTVKRVFLELGGKSAYVVLDDADLAEACATAGFTVCTHAGQGCALTTRLLVPRDRVEEAVEACAATMRGIEPGDPADPGTVCGPLISGRQRDRVEDYLKLAADEGGRIVCGGRRPPEHEKGFYIEPTLIAGLGNDARVSREEIFGPVLVVIGHDGDDDAVRIANDSPYGLSGTVHGTDTERAHAVADRLRTGTVSVNGGLWYSADAPFGGYKQSGIGREMGVAGFEEYLETKLVAEPA